MKLYDKKQIDWKNILFDNRTLFWLLLPIVIEQLLNSLMGMVDTMMVSTVGSEAISAVSLVGSINNLVIQIFSAMASGAAIICSQYIGSGNKKESNRAAGQAIGARRTEEAKYYIVKLMGIAWIGVLVSCLLVFAITKPVTWISGMEPEAAAMCFDMVTAMTIVKPLVWVGAFGIPYGLRAAGDVKFSMIVSVSTMWGCRVAFCIFLVRVFHFGLMAVWIGIFVDWIVRAVIFSTRFLNGKWLHGNLFTQK